MSSDDLLRLIMQTTAGLNQLMKKDEQSSSINPEAKKAGDLLSNRNLSRSKDTVFAALRTVTRGDLNFNTQIGKQSSSDLDDTLASTIRDLDDLGEVNYSDLKKLKVLNLEQTYNLVKQKINKEQEVLRQTFQANPNKTSLEQFHQTFIKDLKYNQAEAEMVKEVLTQYEFMLETLAEKFKPEEIFNKSGKNLATVSSIFENEVPKVNNLDKFWDKLSLVSLEDPTLKLLINHQVFTDAYGPNKLMLATSQDTRKNAGLMKNLYEYTQRQPNNSTQLFENLSASFSRLQSIEELANVVSAISVNDISSFTDTQKENIVDLIISRATSIEKSFISGAIGKSDSLLFSRLASLRRPEKDNSVYVDGNTESMNFRAMMDGLNRWTRANDVIESMVKSLEDIGLLEIFQDRLMRIDLEDQFKSSIADRASIGEQKSLLKMTAENGLAAFSDSSTESSYPQHEIKKVLNLIENEALKPYFITQVCENFKDDEVLKAAFANDEEIQKLLQESFENLNTVSFDYIRMAKDSTDKLKKLLETADAITGFSNSEDYPLEDNNFYESVLEKLETPLKDTKPFLLLTDQYGILSDGLKSIVDFSKKDKTPDLKDSLVDSYSRKTVSRLEKSLFDDIKKDTTEYALGTSSIYVSSFLGIAKKLSESLAIDIKSALSQDLYKNLYKEMNSQLQKSKSSEFIFLYKKDFFEAIEKIAEFSGKGLNDLFGEEISKEICAEFDTWTLELSLSESLDQESREAYMLASKSMKNILQANSSNKDDPDILANIVSNFKNSLFDDIATIQVSEFGDRFTRFLGNMSYIENLYNLEKDSLLGANFYSELKSHVETLTNKLLEDETTKGSFLYVDRLTSNLGLVKKTEDLLAKNNIQATEGLRDKLTNKISDSIVEATQNIKDPNDVRYIDSSIDSLGEALEKDKFEQEKSKIGKAITEIIENAGPDTKITKNHSLKYLINGIAHLHLNNLDTAKEFLKEAAAIDSPLNAYSNLVRSTLASVQNSATFQKGKTALKPILQHIGYNLETPSFENITNLNYWLQERGKEIISGKLKANAVRSDGDNKVISPEKRSSLNLRKYLLDTGIVNPAYTEKIIEIAEKYLSENGWGAESREIHYVEEQ
ncbi:MAG: hypothetical protein MK033_03970 [Candidatus Caenarcaniphilales bacterium]|nr:hypothetical protein [Candidatus Caenarcaniphilales bacterium]